MNRRRRVYSGFTLAELLVVLGIIVLLIGISIPVVSTARRSARDVQCASNMRQLAQALIGYAGQNRGYFPPNSAEIGQFWYLEPIIGPHLTAPARVGRAGYIPAGAEPEAGLADGVFRCSNDLDDSVRSYSMNLYASSVVGPGARKMLSGDNPRGRLFKYGSGGDSSRLMLLVESWPELPVNGTDPLLHVAPAIAGFTGKPGERFGGGYGIGRKDSPDATKGRFAMRHSYVTFYRHGHGYKTIEEPKGKANFAFVDGHVEMLRQDELVGPDGRSTYVAMWSPIDRMLEPPLPE